MRRFDLLDEYTCIAAPRFSSAREREPDDRSVQESAASINWRYSAAGIVAILAIALVAL
jgi:hypothetical protein